MASKNISFFEVDDESYLLIDHHFLIPKWYNYKDAYNYYDIDVNNILRYKKSDNEYVVRYIDKYRSAIALLQIKIKNHFVEMHKLKNDITLMSIEKMIKNFLENLEKYGIRLLN